MAIALRFGVDFAIQCFAWAHRVPGVDKARVAFSQNASVVHFAIAACIASAIASFETAILSHGAKVSQPCDKKSVESSDMKRCHRCGVDDDV